jgi:ketosteroid isomerase-like protein
MIKIKGAVVLAIGLVLVPSWQAQQSWRTECIQRCVSQQGPRDAEMETQEIVSLEREAARAIQLSNATFFQRVYSDDFSGTLSHGQQITKDQWIATIQTPGVQRESFNATDIKVRVFQNIAIVTSLWSSRFMRNGQHIGNQLRATHIYINTPSGWRVVSGQITSLPPDVQQVL